MLPAQVQVKKMDYFDFSAHLTSTPYVVRKGIEDKAIQEAKKNALKYGDKTIPIANALADQYVETASKKYGKKIKQIWAAKLDAIPKEERELYDAILDAYLLSVKQDCFQKDLYNRIQAIFAHKSALI